MTHRRYPHLVTLEQSGIELNPPVWNCAADDQGAGIVLFTGRFHAGITVATRVHFKDRIYHVDTFVNRAGRDVEMVLNCHEVFD